MNSRNLLLALAASLGCLPLAFRGSVHADVRGAHPLTAIVGAQGLTRDTNGDGLADMGAARDAVSLTTIRIRPVMPGKTPPPRPAAATRGQ